MVKPMHLQTVTVHPFTLPALVHFVTNWALHLSTVTSPALHYALVSLVIAPLMHLQTAPIHTFHPDCACMAMHFQTANSHPWHSFLLWPNRYTCKQSLVTPSTLYVAPLLLPGPCTYKQPRPATCLCITDRSHTCQHSHLSLCTGH